ncbi:hypothetical protein CWS43_01150 [Rahnella sp. AA]|nr:hypothetical protein CWS43_01150 [Rahnella sp. AA]
MLIMNLLMLMSRSFIVFLKKFGIEFHHEIYLFLKSIVDATDELLSNLHRKENSMPYKELQEKL